MHCCRRSPTLTWQMYVCTDQFLTSRCCPSCLSILLISSFWTTWPWPICYRICSRLTRFIIPWRLQFWRCWAAYCSLWILVTCLVDPCGPISGIRYHWPCHAPAMTEDIIWCGWLCAKLVHVVPQRPCQICLLSQVSIAVDKRHLCSATRICPWTNHVSFLHSGPTTACRV